MVVKQPALTINLHNRHEAPTLDQLAQNVRHLRKLRGASLLRSRQQSNREITWCSRPPPQSASVHEELRGHALVACFAAMLIVSIATRCRLCASCCSRCSGLRCDLLFSVTLSPTAMHAGASTQATSRITQICNPTLAPACQHAPVQAFSRCQRSKPSPSRLLDVVACRPTATHDKRKLTCTRRML